MFFSKLPLVFLATVLGTTCGERNGYPYPQSNGPNGHSSPQPNELQGYPYLQTNGPTGFPLPQLNGLPGYPYPLINRPSGHSSSQPDKLWLPPKPSLDIQYNDGLIRCFCTELKGGSGYPYPQPN